MKKTTVFLLCFVLASAFVAVAASPTAPKGVQEWNSPADYQKATGKKIPRYNESPMLKDLVAKGALPSVDKRLPAEPLVVQPLEEIGQYGGQIVGYSTTQGLGHIDWGTTLALFQLDGLLRPGPDSTGLVPNVCSAYEMAKDGKSIVIHLRKGIRWSDGVPFSADDILFTYNDIIMDEKVALQTGMAAQKSYYSPTSDPAKIEKIDDFTVRFTFPAPYPIFPLQMVVECGIEGKILFPKHYLQKFHIKYNPDADTLAKSKGLNHWWELFPTMADVQTGPQNTTVGWPTLRAYVLKEVQPGYLIGERNPYYWKVDTAGNQLPYVDKIMVIQNLDPQVVTSKIIAGDFDYANGAIEDLQLLKKNEGAGKYTTYLWKNALTSVFGFEFNLTYKDDPVLASIFRDVRFRRAMSLAINRSEINDVAFNGLAVPGQASCMPSMTRYYEDSFGKAYAQYDVSQANSLLDQMGLAKKDGDGFRLRSDGKRLSVLIEYADGFSAPIFELTKEYWEKVGVEVTLKPESAKLIFERYPTNVVQVGGWQDDRGTTEDSLIQYPSRYVPCGWPPYNNEWPLWLQWAQSNGKQGEEPIAEVKKNLDALRTMGTTTSDAERVAAAKQILRSQAENLWVIGTVGYPPFIRIVRSTIHNVPTDGFMGTWGDEAY
ncbi:MAG TPA: ABC transporter substrate-binding protein, partial [Spirochaetia bacterium]|nr:ABC transporter substrate-binding protein [Spirochaetia bacterium]